MGHVARMSPNMRKDDKRFCKFGIRDSEGSLKEKKNKVGALPAQGMVSHK
jgi:hypothetical protein